MPGLGAQDLHELNVRLSGHQVSGEQTELGKQQLRQAVSGLSRILIRFSLLMLLNCCQYALAIVVILARSLRGWRGGNKRANKVEQADVDFDWPGDSD